MKLLLVLCALIAVVAASSYDTNTFGADSNGNLGNPGYNRAFDTFDVPTRGRRRHYRKHRHSDSSSDSSSDFSSDSSSDSDSHSRSSSSESHSFEHIIVLPNYAPAQDAPSYGGASQDAPAQTNYGAPAQDNGDGY
uniref:Secreted protein n=1 Tax=Caenorhabditis tropicalis TaxID=1561998 RepID=A0A1I7UPX8_9PELO